MIRKLISFFVPSAKEPEPSQEFPEPLIVREDVDPNAISWLLSNDYELHKIPFGVFKLSKAMPSEFLTDLKERYPYKFEYHCSSSDDACIGIRWTTDEEHMLLQLVGAIPT